MIYDPDEHTWSDADLEALRQAINNRAEHGTMTDQDAMLRDLILMLMDERRRTEQAEQKASRRGHRKVVRDLADRMAVHRADSERLASAVVGLSSRGTRKRKALRDAQKRYAEAITKAHDIRQAVNHRGGGYYGH